MSRHPVENLAVGNPGTRLALRLLMAALLLGAAGCSPLRLLSAVGANGTLQASDVHYTDAASVALDVFAPEDFEQGPPRAVVVFFYGGGWQEGDKANYRFVAAQLTRRGFVAVLPDYRLYPQVRFPTFVDDAAAAVAWTLEHATEYGGDPERVFVMGHSAGAHIGALVHYAEDYLARAGASRRPCGFVGLAGPYDFLPLVSPTLKDVFPEAHRADSQPINFVDGDEGPALLLHGLHDNTVKPRNSASLAESVAQAGGEVELEIYDQRGHAGLLLSLSGSLDFLAPALGDITGFIRRQQCDGDH